MTRVANNDRGGMQHYVIRYGLAGVGVALGTIEVQECGEVPALRKRGG